LGEPRDERKNLEEDDDYYYQLDLSNVGGLVMPVILEFHFVDGSKKEVRIPAEIWKLQDQVSKVFVFDKKVKQIILDPHKEIADVEKSNNYWPKDVVPEVFKITAYEISCNPFLAVVGNLQLLF
jgi:hypothetical protein